MKWICLVRRSFPSLQQWEASFWAKLDRHPNAGRLNMLPLLKLLLVKVSAVGRGSPILRASEVLSRSGTLKGGWIDKPPSLSFCCLLQPKPPLGTLVLFQLAKASQKRIRAVVAGNKKKEVGGKPLQCQITSPHLLGAYEAPSELGKGIWTLPIPSLPLQRLLQAVFSLLPSSVCTLRGKGAQRHEPAEASIGVRERGMTQKSRGSLSPLVLF